MLTTAIRSRVRDNINRDDPGINDKIQDWINEAKREAERRLNFDYMRAVDKSLTVTNASPAATLPARFKELIIVKYRKTLPASEEEFTWTEIRPVTEDEVLEVETFESAGTVFTGAPEGYTLEVTDPGNVATLTVHPKPESGKTYTLALAYWRYSADWAFGASEEPYLAYVAPDFLIKWATKLGFDFLGELTDAAKWERDAEFAWGNFRGGEAARALSGPIVMRPSTGAADTRRSRPGGWNDV